MSRTRVIIVVGLGILLMSCASQQKMKNNHKIAESNVQLGIGYLQQGKVEAALVKIKKALEVEPDYPEAHSSIALVYQQLGENKKSLEHYERALELKPESGNTHNNYANLLCNTGKPLEAEAHFLQAIKSRGYRTPAQALENLGSCMMKIPDLNKAEKYLRQALQINPRLPKALMKMARVSLEKKRYMSGRAYLQRYQEIAEMNPESLTLGIEIEKNLGDEKTAMDYESQLRRKFPDSTETRQSMEKDFGVRVK